MSARSLVPRVLLLVASLALGVFAFAWWAMAHLAADASDGTPCFGMTAAYIQLGLAYCGAACSLWAATALARTGLGSGRPSWRLPLLLVSGLAVVWLAIWTFGC
jgi:hypothetical protein